MANRARPGDDQPRDEQVHLVTSANKPHSEEISNRAKKYLISMGIRTVCVVLAIFVLQGWMRLIAIVGALVLPWFAVVIANAGPIQSDEEPEFVDVSRKQIEGGAKASLEAAREEREPSEDEAAASDAASDGQRSDGQRSDGQRAASATMGAEPPPQRRPYAS